MAAVPPRSKCARLWCAPIRIAALICLSLAIPMAAHAQNALPFARSYLITGNYAVVGVDLLPQQADCSTFSPVCYAKGSITVQACTPTSTPGSCVPADADVLAAFMYWETITSDPSTILNAKIQPGGTSSYSSLTITRRSQVSLPSQASCLSSSGSSLTLVMSSADVLRFFPFRKDSASKQTALREVIGTHQIALPEVGNGNQARQSAGASLFFVYRVPTDKLRKVVVYDGAYLQYPIGTTMQQTLQGFYQSWTDNQSAWLTHIVGSGAKNTTELLKFNDSTVASDPVVGANDPFPFPLGDEGGSGSDRAWANPTYDVSGKMSQTSTLSGFGETASTSVDHANNTPYECLTWAAVVFSTVVKDADGDGLPDGLEDASSGLKDPDADDPLINPDGRPLPNLNAMGASSAWRDVFIEMNGMHAPAGTKYGDSTAPFSTILSIPYLTAPEHYHLPTPEVIRLMGDAFKSAPGSLPTAGPIHLHVDVGNITTYKGRPGFSSSQADEYLVCTRAQQTIPCTGPSPDARGGEIIEEEYCNPNLQTLNPTQSNSLGCHFPFFPGTVGWQLGFQHYHDQAVDGDDGHTLTPAQEDQCYLTGYPQNPPAQSSRCRRRFDPIRTGLFHYFLYAHAMGIPKGKPCLDVSVPSNPKDVDASGKDALGVDFCTAPLINNPNYHVPRSTSGAGHAPGGKALITVGLWDFVNHVGSPFLVAATSLHEFGHNVDLSHGGKPPVWGNTSTATKFEPNCKPNYPSIMSYLFQVNGLLDLDGNARIDYSRGTYGDTGHTDSTFLYEANLYDRFLLLPDASLNAANRYRTAWFVPVVAPADGQPGNLAYTLGVQPALRYCTGVKFGDTTPSMGRFDGPGLSATPTTTSLIDWDLDATTPSAAQDVNFDGIPGASYQGYNDWANIRLNQIGAGKNPAGFSLGQTGFEFGQTGFEFGQTGFEFGQTGFDFGQGSFEHGQTGFEFGQTGFDFGDGSFTFGQTGFEFGQTGFEFGQTGFDFGQTGFDFGQTGFDFGNDLDFDQVKRNGYSPPLAAKASVITAGSSLHRHRVTWNPPNVGTISAYKVFRALGATIGGSSTVEQLCSVGGVPSGMPACTSATTFDDPEELPYTQSFTYFVRAVFSNCNADKEKCESGPSNFTTVVAVNTAPVAVNDPPGNNKWTVSPGQSSALVVLTNDTDEDSATKTKFRVLITVLPAHGSVAMEDGYVPGDPSTYIAKLAADGSVVYTPTAGYSGTDAFKYKADNGTWRTTTGPKMSDWSTSEATVTFTVKK